MIESFLIDTKIRVRDPKDLLVLPRVIRITTIDEEGASRLTKEVSLAHQAEQSILPVVIDSEGGEIYSLWTMVDTLESSEIPIATIVTGKAMSAAVALFCCGAPGYRFIGPHATLMIHDVSSEEVGGKSQEMKANAEETDRLNKQLYEFMEQRIGKRKGHLWRLAQKNARADLYLTPEEAVKHGIADHIKVPTFKTTVTVEVKLEFTE